MSLLNEAALRALIREEVRAALAEVSGITSTDVLLTVHQAASEFSVTPSTLRRWMADGRLRRVGDGRNTRVLRTDVVAAFGVRAAGKLDVDRVADEIIRSAG